MRKLHSVTLIGVAFLMTAAYAAAGTASVQKEDAARPSDSTANVPSAVGAQATTPAGAVTGAGHAQSLELKELEYGRAGGLQQRAREREQATDAGAVESALRE